MGLSVHNNNTALHINNRLKVNHNQMNESINKLSTGSKLNHAKNDPAAYQIYLSMTAKLMSVDQSNRNTQTSNALLNTASGAVNSSVDALSSLRENLLNAANGTNNESDIQAIQEQVNQVAATLNDNANVEFNGKRILDGSMSGDRALVTAGEDGSKTSVLGDMTTDGLGLTTNGQLNLNLTTPDGISKALDLVDGAMQSALSQATSIGAAQKGLEYRSDNYTTMSENLTASSSTIGDTDMAKEAMKLHSFKTLGQAKLMMMAQANQSSSGVLAMLR